MGDSSCLRWNYLFCIFLLFFVVSSLLASASALLPESDKAELRSDESNRDERAATCNGLAPLQGGNSADGFCSYVYAKHLGKPRGMRLASNGDLLVVDQRSGKLYALWDSNNDGFSDDNERTTLLATNLKLNHGIALDERRGWLYASTSSEVHRWQYNAAQRSVTNGQMIINHIPCCGHHTTRTLEVDINTGELYVTVGSMGNVDDDDAAAQIRKFDPTAIASGSYLAWTSGFLWASGLRNEVGIRFDHGNPAQGRPPRLWGVENGVDFLRRDDIGDVHNSNPSEEVNLLDRPGAFYGFPYCWTAYDIPNVARGAQRAHPKFWEDGVHNDAWCDNDANVVKPAYSLTSHVAPLDIIFYNGTEFPRNYQGSAFISLHGSWNRNPPAGYSVVRLEFENGVPKREKFFFGAEVPHTKRHGGDEDGDHSEEGSGDDDIPGRPVTWKERPVGLAIGRCGTKECVLVSSDTTGQVIAIPYVGKNMNS